MPGTRTQHITNAVQKYLHMNDTDTYSVTTLSVLTEQVKDLKQENNKLKDQCEFYHIQTMPFWKRRAYKKTLKQLPRGLQ